MDEPNKKVYLIGGEWVDPTTVYFPGEGTLRRKADGLWHFVVDKHVKPLVFEFEVTETDSEGNQHTRMETHKVLGIQIERSMDDIVQEVLSNAPVQSAVDELAFTGAEPSSTLYLSIGVFFIGLALLVASRRWKNYDGDR